MRCRSARRFRRSRARANFASWSSGWPPGRMGSLLEGLVIRALAQAVYQQTNIGHFGLALEEYAHFTSPIRRYPDLLVHRAIKAAVVPSLASGHKYSTGELQTLGAESSQRERRADEASRDVMGYLKCLYLQPRVGRELRGHHHQRARVRTVRAAEGHAHRRSGAHLGDPRGLLGVGERRHGARRPAHRPALADGRCGAGAPEPGRSHAAANRFRAARCRCGRLARHRARAASRRRASSASRFLREAQLLGAAVAAAVSAGAEPQPWPTRARTLVYGLHAIGAVIERAPERLLELWMAAPRDDARARRLRERARSGRRAGANGGQRGAREIGGGRRSSRRGGGGAAAQAAGRSRICRQR